MKKCFLIVFAIEMLVICDVHAKPKVTLAHGGSLTGTTMTTVDGRKVNAFLGIPYAEPPTGLLRFKPPVAVKSWTGTRPATTVPSACPQIDIFSADKVPFGDEDCLYVNVYTPQGRSVHNLPVLIWIYGGAFHMGSSDPFMFGPERLLDNDVILATFNYRIGALGFLSTGTVDAPGNYGLKDQNLLLKWVQANIKAFGGDPDDVTLFGQSAGAASVSLHMVSDKSKGLFHKAILQSGNLYDPWAFVDHATSIERLKKLGSLVNCPLNNDNFAGMVTCLRNVPTTALLQTINNFYIENTYYPITVFGPVVEPNIAEAFLVEDPRHILDAHGNLIPIIIGHNADEGTVRSAPIINQNDAHFKENFETVLPKLLDYDHKPDHIKDRITKRIDQFYFKGRHDWSKLNHFKLSDMFTDRLFSLGMDQFLRNRFSSIYNRFGKTYVYVYDHRGPTSATQFIGGGPDFYGVSHGDELPFLFPQGQLSIPGTMADQIMRWAMPQMWTDFAWKGDPTPRKTYVREYWRSTRDFPLRYVTIGKKYNPDYRFRNLDLSPKVHNGTIATSDDSAASENGFYIKYDNDTVERIENESTRYHQHRYYYILKNRKNLFENRIKFWRSLEKLLY